MRDACFRFVFAAGLLVAVHALALSGRILLWHDRRVGR